MSRLDPMPPEALDTDQRELYDAITTGPRAKGPQHFPLTHDDGGLRGPFNAFLLSPATGAALQELGAAIRYRTSLTPRTREIAILMVAAHWRSAFEQAAHESIGRATGLTERELTALRAGTIPDLPDPRERACAHLTHALLQGDIDDTTWQTWTPHIDKPTIFELTTLVGYYATLALQMRAFRVD